MKALKPTAQDNRIAEQASVLSGGYVRKNIQVTEAQSEVLRRLSFELRKSEAELVREALDAWIAKQ